MQKIDIIIPIYNGLEDLKKCLVSIKKHTDLKNNRLILVNDKSPDERVADFLEMQEEKNIVVINSVVNEGFSASVNKGIKYSERDVILLNSDTIVTSGWVEKIARCAYSDKSIGTVTPLSNSATLCSIPVICQDNNIPEEKSIDEYAAVVEKCSLHKYPEITVAVGFCMYIKREVIDAVGLFDGKTFERGYGEENDFCNRAGLLGYKHVLCDDTLIYHKGTVSFVNEEKQQLIKKHTEILERWYPYQMRKNHLYCMTNPDQYIRDNINIWNSVCNGKKNILFVVQSDFREDSSDHLGGTQFHVKDLVKKLKAEFNVFVAARDNDILRLTMYDRQERLSFKFYVGNKDEYPQIYDLKLKEVMKKIIIGFSISLIHVHHIYGLSFDIFDIARELAVPYFMTIHDYYYICPNIKLTSYQGTVCSESKEECLCMECMERKCGVVSRVNFIEIWRKKVKEAIEGAQKIIFPSKESKRIFEVYFSENKEKYQVIYHGLDCLQFNELIINENDIKMSEKVVAYIDNIFEDRFLITGWAFMSEVDSQEVNVILKITDETGKKSYIQCEKTLREDIAWKYQDEKYSYSGFSANVLGMGLNTGKISIQIIIEKNGTYYQGKSSVSGEVGEKKLNNDNLNIAFLGGLVPEKGSRLAYQLIRKFEQDINWYIVGGMNDVELQELEQDNLIKFGTYNREDTLHILKEYKIDIVCILPVWPETFCYTLSEAWLADIPVIATSIGALTERFSPQKGGWLFDVNEKTVENIERLLHTLVMEKSEIKRMKESIAKLHLISVTEMCEEYRKLYEAFAEKKEINKFQYKEEFLQGFRLADDRLYGDMDIVMNNIVERNKNMIQCAADTRIAYYQEKYEKLLKNYGTSMRRLDRIRSSRWYKLWKKFM